jgi:hypothetical protein
MSCAATILTNLCDMDVELGPTIVIIAVALATEYFRLVSLAPIDLLSGICHRLKGNRREYEVEYNRRHPPAHNMVSCRSRAMHFGHAPDCGGL